VDELVKQNQIKSRVEIGRVELSTSNVSEIDLRIRN